MSGWLWVALGLLAFVIFAAGLGMVMKGDFESGIDHDFDDDEFYDKR